MTSNAHSSPTIAYYFSFLSLWSYVGSRAFRDLAERNGARIVYKPVDLMAVFAAGGGKPSPPTALSSVDADPCGAPDAQPAGAASPQLALRMPEASAPSGGQF